MTRLRVNKHYSNKIVRPGGKKLSETSCDFQGAPIKLNTFLIFLT